MKKQTVFILLIFTLTAGQLSAQKVYSIISGEMLFSNGTMEFTDEYMAQFPDAQVSSVPLRYTMFFHLSQNWHFDISPNFGFYTGIGVRNVGIISDEVLYNGSPGIESYQPYKIVRRLYTGGIPLALKLGSFKDNLYLFGGGEIEFGIHYKEKYWNSHDRSGSKTKTTQWFGGQTQSVLPSAIVGVQFPGGVNLKFKYYLNDFLNHNSSNTNFVSDLNRYKTSQVWYLSLSWQLNTAYLKSWGNEDKDGGATAGR